MAAVYHPIYQLLYHYENNERLNDINERIKLKSPPLQAKAGFFMCHFWRKTYKKKPQKHAKLA